MATSGISTYGTNTYDLSNQLQKSSAASMNIQDFLNLLVAQLANQDVMNPVNDTEFVSQMAQFTSLQAMEQLNQLSTMQYGASLIGKTVIVAKYDETGKYVQDEGLIERVNFSGDEITLTINGSAYPLSSVMEVVTASESGDEEDAGAASV